ncbi:MAG TPA: carbon-nitrogen hydrolase family protein [Bryobacteraceae bacterium]|nr:carbon-nitrogen hydrolase family protein [Bryobacteraceae bacterium]
MRTIRIALANLRFPDTPAESVRLAVEAVRGAAAEGAALVCFPECYVPGYRAAGRTVPPPPDQTFLDSAWAEVGDAAGSARVGVVLGTERIVEGRFRITAVVFGPDGKVAGFQDKVQLDPSEEVLYSPGLERQVFTMDGLTFGVAICHEGWRYPETVRWAARRGAQVVFHPHFHEHERGGYIPSIFADPANTFHEKAALCRAAENTCYFATVNCASPGSPSTSAVIRPDGTVQAWQAYGQEGLLVADIDPGQATGVLAARCRTAQ